MSDMSGLKASVLAQSHEKGRLNLAVAKEKIQADFDQKKEQMLLAKESLRRQRLSEIQRHKQRESQQLENQARQSSLATKQAVLKELFQAAQDKMSTWSEEEHVSFFKRVIERYNQEAITVTFGQETKKTLSEQTWSNLLQEYPTMTFSEGTIPEEAGFVISRGQVEDNYLYSSLVAEIWESESYRLASEIFEK